MSSQPIAAQPAKTPAEAPGTLALTFDDGPDQTWTPRVLEALERCQASATFFMVGERVLAQPNIAGMVLAAGHEVQLHCHRHIRHTQLTEQQLTLDTEEALRALQRIDVRPGLWRTPWGVCTEASTNVAEQFDLRLVRWRIDTHDWRGDPPEKMLADNRAVLPDGGTVLMHDALGPGATRARCENTIGLLPMLAAAAHEQNLTFTTMSHCEGSTRPVGAHQR